MVEIDWEEPPEDVLIRARNKSGRYLEFAIALRQHPGRWAVLPSDYTNEKSAQAGAQGIRAGKVSGMPKGEFDAVRKDCKIWVRFVGTKEPTDEVDADHEGDDAPPPESEHSLSPGKVRAWAREQGRDVADHGRLPRELVNDYLAAHPEEPRPSRLQVAR